MKDDSLDRLMTRAVDKVGGATSKWFDGTRGFDGGGFVLPVDPTTGLTEPDVYPYCGTPANLGRACLELLGHPWGRTFIDLGCGKGRMLALAAEAGYRNCVGVELDSGLASAATNNLACTRLRGVKRLGDVASVHNLDARDFDFPDGPLSIYLNNPFAMPILSVVLDRLGHSLSQTPRPVTIVLMRRVIEDPENDSPTAELLQSTPFLIGGRVPVGGPLSRFLQRGYATFRFHSPESPPN